MCTFSDILLLICFFSENMILLLYYRIKIYLKLMFSQICLHIYDTFAHFSILYLRSSLLDHFSPTWSTLCGTLFSGDCLVTNHILFVYFFYLKYIYFSFILEKSCGEVAFLLFYFLYLCVSILYCKFQWKLWDIFVFFFILFYNK